MFNSCNHFTGDINWDLSCSNGNQFLMNAYKFNNNINNITFTGNCSQALRQTRKFDKEITLSSTVNNIYSLASYNAVWDGNELSSFDPSTISSKSTGMQILFYQNTAFNGDVSVWDRDWETS